MQWLYLPKKYGNWNRIYKRFNEYIWAKLLEIGQQHDSTQARELLNQVFELKNYIFTKLQEIWSPNIIAAKIQDNISIDIPIESTYQYSYDQKIKP